MNKKEYVERMSIATYPYDWNFYDEPEGLESPSDIVREARQEHGEDFVKQLVGVSKSHWPKVYGKDEVEAPSWGYDTLDSFWKSPMRIRKDGKANRQDVRARISRYKHGYYKIEKVTRIGRDR
tara:strand:- start:171 stop:539 length:369 start_codon:yes stop_codon:yes gene_type:complete